MTLSFAGESRSSADGRAGRVAVGLVFYGSLLVVLVAVLVELLPHLIPVGLANRIGHNSEAYLLTVLLALWIQLIRPRVSADRRAVCITATAAVVCIAVALVLLASDWPSRFRTLNETFLAAMLLIPYVQLSRRPSRRGALAISLGLLCVVAALGTTALVTSLAETLGVLILAPIAFDVVDKRNTRRGAHYLHTVATVLVHHSGATSSHVLIAALPGRSPGSPRGNNPLQRSGHRGVSLPSSRRALFRGISWSHWTAGIRPIASYTLRNLTSLRHLWSVRRRR